MILNFEKTVRPLNLYTQKKKSFSYIEILSEPNFCVFSLLKYVKESKNLSQRFFHFCNPYLLFQKAMEKVSKC